VKKILVCAAFIFLSRTVVAAEQPRLVVQITIDQLRGDLPLRYRDRFGEGGFVYFMNHGTWYTDAHHPHSHTETIVGHTTLATGAYPSRHGMVANAWFDRATDQLIDNVEGSQYPLLSVNGETQTGPGASPTSILTTTFSDELAFTTNGKAKLFSVSIKDRGAIPLSGHAGKAFWFSMTNGCFVSSTFYYQAYPQWVADWCKKNPANQYAGTTWNLLKPQSTYLYSNITNQYPAGSVAEGNMQLMASYGFGRTFPHKFPPASAGPGFYNPLTTSPMGDELTLNFVETLIKSEHLGKDAVPDYLAVSFSATDLISHWWSPASLESEDNILRLDTTLRNLLSIIDREVGLSHTLIVLSGDHGGIEYPEYLTTLGIPTGYLTPQQILNTANQALAARYGSISGIIAQYSHPYFYLDQQVLAQNKLDKAEVENVIAKSMMTLTGVRAAFTTAEMRVSNGSVDPAYAAQVGRNFNPARSGDVYLVQQPQWIVLEANQEGSPNLLQHNSGWAYDTYVPIAFAGGHVPVAMISRSVYTTDVAATLAVLLHTKYPAACVGVPLSEVVPQKAAATAKPSH
jgi:type I phosphodiesterase/nucleotide pyrophosphatase